jgi:hypothetical protein
MKKTQRAAAVAGLLLCAAGAAVAGDAASAPAAARFTLKDVFVGSMIARDVVASAIPFDKTWAELTPQQKDIVRDDYESLGPDDEPPFPLHGLREAVTPLVRQAVTQGAQGKLVASVIVDSEGHGRDVSVYKTPGPDMTTLVARLLAAEQYKPASCKGQPCSMPFVLRLEFLEHN